MHTITEDGTLHWHCQRREWQDDPPCNAANSCRVDEAVYQEQGGVIVLPACPACGARLFLKADYTAKELARAITYVHAEETGESAYVLPKRYTLSLQLHWLLYERGMATLPPAVARPPQALREHPGFAHLKGELLAGLWYGYSVARARGLLAIGAGGLALLEGG